MALYLVDYERKTHESVQAFWGNREAARRKQIESGKADQGERAGVTGGKNMDGFMALALDLVRANGLAHAQIHQQRAVLALPGYFRPTKLWDLLVIHKGELIAAIELKSQVGPSFGNNFNATVIASPRTAAETGEFSDLSAMTGLKTFVTSLAGHIAAEAARLDS